MEKALKLYATENKADLISPEINKKLINAHSIYQNKFDFYYNQILESKQLQAEIITDIVKNTKKIANQWQNYTENKNGMPIVDNLMSLFNKKSFTLEDCTPSLRNETIPLIIAALPLFYHFGFLVTGKRKMG